VRLALVAATALGSLVTLARARPLPWVAASGWRRASLGASVAFSMALLAIAARW
jgi:hypothetical protein